MQYEIPVSASYPEMTPSQNRKPAASSKAFPGVRIVIATLRVSPPARTRVSRGSSVATRSKRGTAAPSMLATMRTSVDDPLRAAPVRSPRSAVSNSGRNGSKSAASAGTTPQISRDELLEGNQTGVVGDDILHGLSKLLL